jgi:catalase
MAVKFYLPDGTVTDLIALTIPVFFGRTPDEVLEGLKTLKPDPATGKPDEKRITLGGYDHLLCRKFKKSEAKTYLI